MPPEIETTFEGDASYLQIVFEKFDCFLDKKATSWSVLRIKEIMKDKAWDFARFFRVVPGFVVQFRSPCMAALGGFAPRVPRPVSSGQPSAAFFG